ENQAAIVESAMIIRDGINSSYFFRGQVKNKQIIIKPDPSVLETWPNWAGPPSRKDLKKCKITLDKVGIEQKPIESSAKVPSEGISTAAIAEKSKVESMADKIGS
ncbi:MAG: hypothetical protein GTO60_14290, partial [Gammaproteobacteria bacterium]|nr:hypothetical protein [Gammaproteobacteria bacterium]